MTFKSIYPEDQIDKVLEKIEKDSKHSGNPEFSYPYQTGALQSVIKHMASEFSTLTTMYKHLDKQHMDLIRLLQVAQDRDEIGQELWEKIIEIVK